MKYYSSLSLNEFLSLNTGIIPPELENVLQSMLQSLQDQLSDKELEIDRIRKREELIDEQLGYATALVERVEKFAKENLSKRLQKEFFILRSDSSFEG